MIQCLFQRNKINQYESVNCIENNYNDEDIEIKRKSNITILKAFGRQNLDGIRMTLSLEIENKTAC